MIDRAIASRLSGPDASTELLAIFYHHQEPIDSPHNEASCQFNPAVEIVRIPRYFQIQSHARFSAMNTDVVPKTRLIIIY
jgi:hypothetical protein